MSVKDLEFPKLSDLGKRKSASMLQGAIDSNQLAKKQKVDSCHSGTTDYFERVTKDAAISSIAEEPEATDGAKGRGVIADELTTKECLHGNQKDTAVQTLDDSQQPVSPPIDTKNQCTTTISQKVEQKDVSVQTMDVDALTLPTFHSPAPSKTFASQQDPNVGTMCASDGTASSVSVLPPELIHVAESGSSSELILDALIRACAAVIPSQLGDQMGIISPAASENISESHDFRKQLEMQPHILLDYKSSYSYTGPYSNYQSGQAQGKEYLYDRASSSYVPEEYPFTPQYGPGASVGEVWDQLTQYGGTERVYQQHFGFASCPRPDSAFKYATPHIMETGVPVAPRTPGNIKPQSAALEIDYYDADNDLQPADLMDDLSPEGEVFYEQDVAFEQMNGTEESGGWPPPEEKECWKSHVVRKF